MLEKAKELVSKADTLASKNGFNTFKIGSVSCEIDEAIGSLDDEDLRY